MRVVICTSWFDWKHTRCSTPQPAMVQDLGSQGIPLSIQLQAVFDSLSDPSKSNKENSGCLGVRGHNISGNNGNKSKY